MMNKLNVILLLIDGARVDRIEQFPIFKKLQENGTFFQQMITHAPYTLVSMNSIFTGMGYVKDHFYLYIIYQLCRLWPVIKSNLVISF